MRCKMCSAEVEDHKYVKETAAFMRTNCLCYLCTFWTKIAQEHDPNRFREGHRVYYIYDENSKMTRGFGGHKVSITLGDKTIISTNLWCNGDAPDWALDAFPEGTINWNPKKKEEDLPF